MELFRLSPLYLVWPLDLFVKRSSSLPVFSSTTPELTLRSEPNADISAVPAVETVVLPENDTLSEKEWVSRAQSGDTAAFEWLMNRYRDRAIRLAAHILRRPADAEDLVQEAFLRAFTQIREFRGDSAFYTWLYRIVVRLCLNRMRSPDWQRERALVDDDWLEKQSSLSEAEQFENRLLIEVLLDRLTPPLRAALVLREVEGLEYEEIALSLKVPVGTVRSRLNAARTQFRSLWLRAMEEENHVY